MQRFRMSKTIKSEKLEVVVDQPFFYLEENNSIAQRPYTWKLPRPSSTSIFMQVMVPRLFITSDVLESLCIP